MSDHTVLIGAEDVKKAGYYMSSAAEDFNRSILYFEQALYRHQGWADEWLDRLEAVLERANPQEVSDDN